MKDFKDIMSKRTDIELLEITTNHRDSYRSEAVIDAEKELKNRNLTAQQIEELQKLLDFKKLEKDTLKEKNNILQRFTANILDTFNPIIVKSTDKKIQMITVGLLISYLLHLINNLGLIILELQNFGSSDMRTLVYFTSLILFPIGLYGFSATKKYGWIILTILFSFFTLTTLNIIGLEIKWAMQLPTNYENTGPVQIQDFNNPELNNLLSKKGLVLYIGQLLILVSLLIFINKLTITEKYIISRQTQLFVFVISLVIFVLLD